MSLRVKICGVTGPEDAAAAAGAGVSAVGVVLWPGSPRGITMERARSVAAAIPADVTLVGVFVDQPPSFVARAAREVPLHAVQLHGRERLADYDLEVPILKAIGVDGPLALSMIEALPAGVLPLLDARDDRRKGGTGHAIDWDIAAAAARARRIALAGGLTPENIAEAIRIVRPYAIDVSSGVERAPGVKDPEKMAAFLTGARQAAGTVPRGLL